MTGTLTVQHLHAPITADQVDAVRFTPVRLREGYNMKEVDDYLDRVTASLRGSQTLTSRDVSDVKFTPVRLREGYDMGEVDTFLDVVIATLDAGTSTPAQEPAQAEASTDTHPPLDGPFTVCETCFAPIRVVDEESHRGWHVSLLGQR